jgi:hypothetical protein
LELHTQNRGLRQALGLPVPQEDELKKELMLIPDEGESPMSTGDIEARTAAIRRSMYST